MTLRGKASARLRSFRTQIHMVRFIAFIIRLFAMVKTSVIHALKVGVGARCR